MRNRRFHKRSKRTQDFRNFKNKIFFRTVLLVLIAVISFYLLYRFLFSGNFANWMVSAYQRLFRLDYDAAYILYQHTFRNNTDLIMVAAVACMFFILFRIYLNWFTRYFEEIGSGMDRLLKEQTEEISLSPELLPLERRLNTVRHTIETQKNDILASEKRKNDLIMYLAHDLKTPLASVIGYVNLLRDEKEISEEVREKYLSIALDKAERLEELINEFFEIARFHVSDITLQSGRISLTRLLEQLVFEFGPMLKEKNLNAKLYCGEEVMIVCDADKIQRVFDNLLRNAVMYGREGSEIEIRVGQSEAILSQSGDNMRKQDGNEKAERAMQEIAAAADPKSGSAAGSGGAFAVSVSVINYGDTIPEEKLDRIFEQFYRLDSARGTRNGGAGLGLAIAKQIVELHGGSICAQSKDKRTCFTVTLPTA